MLHGVVSSSLRGEDISSSPLFLAAVEDERRRILERCILAVPERHRKLLALRYGHGMTLLAIAVEFGVSEPAVHKMHKRILARLKQQLAELRITRFTDL